MKLTVLGCYGPYPPADGGCSSYLLEADGLRILLDAGSGALSRLQRHVDIAALDAVLLSHLHADHMGEMPILRYALARLAAEGKRAAPLPVYAPDAPDDARAGVSGGVFLDHTIGEGSRVELGGIVIDFYPVQHPVPAFAMRISHEGRVLCYSGDSVATPKLVEAARGADLFVCDAAFLHGELTPSSPHPSSRQAAEMAREAGVKRLLLTHHAPYADPEAAMAEAKEVFAACEWAVEGTTYSIA